METHKTKNSQNNLDKEQSWRYHTSRFQSILQSQSNQNSMIMARNQQLNEWNRMKNPEISPHLYDQLF